MALDDKFCASYSVRRTPSQFMTVRGREIMGFNVTLQRQKDH